MFCSSELINSDVWRSGGADEVIVIESRLSFFSCYESWSRLITFHSVWLNAQCALHTHEIWFLLIFGCRLSRLERKRNVFVSVTLDVCVCRWQDKRKLINPKKNSHGNRSGNLDSRNKPECVCVCVSGVQTLDTRGGSRRGIRSRWWFGSRKRRNRKEIVDNLFVDHPQTHAQLFKHPRWWRRDSDGESEKNHKSTQTKESLDGKWPDESVFVNVLRPL